MTTPRSAAPGVTVCNATAKVGGGYSVRSWELRGRRLLDIAVFFSSWFSGLSSACVASARGTLVSSPYPTSNHAGKGDFACVLPAVWAVDTVLLIARYSEEDAEGAGLEGDVAAARMP
jgi:hypothetical protein